MQFIAPVRHVAQLFDLQESRLRYWAQTGFVGPSVRKNGRSYYTFEDLVGVKLARELLGRNLPVDQVRHCLEILRERIAQHGGDISGMTVTFTGDDVIIAEEPTADAVVCFDVDDVAPLAPEADESRADAAASLLELFDRSLAAEEAGDDAAARKLYGQALAVDPRFAAAWTNLGNLAARSGNRGEARHAYAQALDADPEQPEARFNLANLLADVGEDTLAIGEYRRVLTLCPTFADAHYNLALLYVTQGAHEDARPHLEHYLSLDPSSTWAAEARRLLASSTRQP